MFSYSRLLVLSVAMVLAPVALARAEIAAAAASGKIEEKTDKIADYVDNGATSGSFLSGRFARQQGDRGSAIHYLEDALAQDPKNLGLAGQLLVLSLAAGETDAAVARARQLQDAPEHEPLVNLVLAVEAVRSSRFEEAESQFKKVFEGKEPVLWSPLFLAWVEVGRGTLKKPLTSAHVLPKGKNMPSFLAYQAALINDLAGFPAAAAQQYALALADQSKAPFRAVEAAADFYRRQGDEEKLAQLKANYASAHPGASVLVDSETTAHLATLMEQRIDGEGVEERLVGSPAEGVAEVLFTMASVLYAVDVQQDSLLYLRLALSLRPDFPLAQLLLGGMLEAEERYADAAAVYGNVRTQGPLAERALLRHAYMVEKQGRLEEALAMLDKRAAQFPQDYDAFVAKGDLLRARSRYAEAAEAYGKAIARIPEVGERHWGIFFARGACLERIGRWERAEADLRRALALSPEQPEALNYLGYGLLTRDVNLEEARELIEQAYALQPGAPHIIDSLGWALYKNGDYEGAVKQLEQAIEQVPGDATVNDHLGDAYWQSGRKTEARYQWERALTFSPEAELERALRRKLKEGLPPLSLRPVAAASQEGSVHTPPPHPGEGMN